MPAPHLIVPIRLQYFQLLFTHLSSLTDFPESENYHLHEARFLQFISIVALAAKPRQTQQTDVRAGRSYRTYIRQSSGHIITTTTYNSLTCAVFTSNGHNYASAEIKEDISFYSREIIHISIIPDCSRAGRIVRHVSCPAECF